MSEGGPLHPRPQCARAHWIDLCGPWGFAYDDRDTGLSDEWWRREDVFTRRIVVPFPPESPASGIGDTGFHPILWYRRTVDLAPRVAGKRLILHFGAVDYRAQVWVNGIEVARHEGGHTPFQADISDALAGEGPQTIVVRAEDLPGDRQQPRGKQDWEERPHAIWYDRTSGIWQPVWLEWVSPLHIAGLHWTADTERGLLNLALELNRAEPAGIRARLRCGDTRLPAHDHRAVSSHSELALDLAGAELPLDQLLWSPEHPTLIDAVISITAGDRTVDEVHSYAGFRGVGTGSGRFLLNGRPYYLRLALEQGFWPASHLAAPSQQAMRREVELAKALGFNGLRLHQKVEDPRFLYWCDRLGLLVWGEMANAYDFSPAAEERLEREWREVLQRDVSHPCIAAWIPINESWGVPDLSGDPAQRAFGERLYWLTKAFDPTRPVIANDGWEFVIGDLLGIHDYTHSGETIRARYGSGEAIERTLRQERPGGHQLVLPGAAIEGLPVILSELGGIFYPAEDAAKAGSGYGRAGTPEELLRRYADLIGAVLDCPDLTGFCYTQLTDTQQETNGLLTAARAPKVPLDKIAAINRGEATTNC